MSATVLYQSHRCPMPAFDILHVDSVIECSCGKRWVKRWTYLYDETWVPLRWYHMAARRGLREVSRG